MMKTPLCDFLDGYVKENKIRFHMPGHKGKREEEKFDITEVEGADVLYCAEGILRESMENASALFGTEKTLFSTEGSSLSIRAMVYLIRLYALSKGKRPLIAAFRNAHKSFVTACAITGTPVEWLYGDEGKGITCCNITEDKVRAYFEKAKELPSALYVTSPDYLGNMADIKSLGRLCREKGVILAVDNAHGAYLNFLPEKLHPIKLGADICCDSAHKTLPVLTGGAYLHISKKAPSLFSERAQQSLSLFASTSPSYLILRSLDAVNGILAGDYGKRLDFFIGDVSRLKEKLISRGYSLLGDEPLKITLDCKKYGYEGFEIARHLSDNNIVCEFADADYLVLMLTVDNGKSELEALAEALCSLEKKEVLKKEPVPVAAAKKGMELWECIYLPTEKIPVRKAEGRICASFNVSCPPAIPVCVAGEIIEGRQIELLDYYGIKEIEVII